MADNMRLYLELMGKSGNLRSELNSTKGAVRTWSSAVRKEFASLRQMAGGLAGQLGALGIGFSAVRIMSDSAKMDKALTRTKLTAGATAREMALLRKELFSMARQTGQPLEGLQAGLDGLIASGLKLPAALETLKAINMGSAVTGAQATTLSGGLTVGSTAFNFDLSKPGMALEMLDKMTVAGRNGNAELENLSDIFARVGVNASSAGMSFDKTLAFIEGLSLVEKQPERLATLADSTLRLFTNLKYMKDAQKSTGVRFFDGKGERRDAMAIIADIKKRYDTLKTDQQRAMFIQKTFGNTDLDTQKGMKTFLQGDALAKVDEFTRSINSAGGTLKEDFGEATGNLVDQVGMLKNDLKDAADGFVKPMNETLAGWIKWARESNENGGAGLDGKDMVKYGLGAAAATAAAIRVVPILTKRFFSAGGNLAGGVAVGAALKEVSGVTPVYVVNMPGGGLTTGLPSGPTISENGAAVRNFSGGAAVLAPLIPAVGMAIAADVSARIGQKLADGDAASSTPEYLRQKRAEHLVMGGGANSYPVRTITELLGDHFSGKQVQNAITLNISIDQNGRVTSKGGDSNTQTTINTMRRGSFTESPMPSH